jgi:hypothetical protein
MQIAKTKSNVEKGEGISLTEDVLGESFGGMVTVHASKKRLHKKRKGNLVYCI